MFRSPSRSRLLATGATLASVALLAACGSSTSGATSQASTEATSGSTTTVPATVPAGVTLRVADQLDFIKDLLSDSGEDKDLPYKIQYSEFVGGPPMLQAFQGGSVDVGYVADTPIIFAQAAGQKIQDVATWETTNGSDALVSAPGVKLSGWASLKGKKVAYQEGTVEEAVLLDGLQSVGLSLKDVTTVNLSTTSITPALDNGSVDAGILVQPLTAAYLAKNPTASQVEVGNNITARTDMLIASDSAIANKGKEAAMANFIGRLEKAYEWVNTHQAAYATDLYVDQYKVPLATGEKLLAASGDYSFITLPGALEAPQQLLANLYYGAGQVPSKVDVSSEFNPVFNSVVEANK